MPEMLIGGEWRAAVAEEQLEVVNPATEDVVDSVPAGTPEDVDLAVATAKRAFADWAATDVEKRAAILATAADLIHEHAKELAATLTSEQGKPLAEAIGEVTHLAHGVRFYAEAATKVRGAYQDLPSTFGPAYGVVIRRPIGVCAAITPYNFPLTLLGTKVAPALASGNTVVAKPAATTPLATLQVARLFSEAGVPDGVVNVITTSSSGRFSQAVLADPRVRKLSFTGSTEVGRVLLKTAADTVTNCSMELGGNAPFLIFEDADIKAALDGAFLAKMRNGGEACTAANRFYVHEAVADEFTAAFAARLGALKVGPGLDDGTELGPLVNEDTRSKVASLVDEATTAGGRVLTGGITPDRRGYFYSPTVLDNVPPDAQILDQEIFGPVAPIVRFSAEQDAIDWANDTEYGLVSYVYTGDLRRSLRVAEALEAGMVGINRGVVSDPAAPFGGVKQSGIGREGGHDGLLEFTETKYIAVDW